MTRRQFLAASAPMVVAPALAAKPKPALIAITLDLYSHGAPGMQKAAALKLDEELAESRVSSPVVISG